MSQSDALKLLKDQNNIRLAAYSISFDPEREAKSTQLHPLAPAYKEMRDILELQNQANQGSN